MPIGFTNKIAGHGLTDMNESHHNEINSKLCQNCQHVPSCVQQPSRLIMLTLCPIVLMIFNSCTRSANSRSVASSVKHFYEKDSLYIYFEPVCKMLLGRKSNRPSFIRGTSKTNLLTFWLPQSEVQSCLLFPLLFALTTRPKAPSPTCSSNFSLKYS